MTVIENLRLTDRFSMLTLQHHSDSLSDILPGQFLQVRIDDSKTTFLRRPISICDVNRETRTLRLLVRRAGDGTNRLCDIEADSSLNVILPLGNGFSLPEAGNAKVLLAGGGVGVAPLLLLGKKLVETGIRPAFLLGARSQQELLIMDEFAKLGDVFVSTDDGSAGEKGLITENLVLADRSWDRIYCCGPKPMMVGIAKAGKRIGARVDVSLENMMACGVGACLCCVEKTVRGNVCVCTEGPVFNVEDLTWFD